LGTVRAEPLIMLALTSLASYYSFASSTEFESETRSAIARPPEIPSMVWDAETTPSNSFTCSERYPHGACSGYRTAGPEVE
jgi:hypothetical protein